MKNKAVNLTVFSIGAFGYGLIEVLWRGHTHWSMLTAGGLSFLGLSRIERTMRGMSLIKKALLGCALITSIEYVFGLIFNVILKKNVWKMFLNLLYQMPLCMLVIRIGVVMTRETLHL